MQFRYVVFFPAPYFGLCRTVEDEGLLNEVGELEHERNANVQQSNPIWKGYKLVGDNLDKNVRPSFQRYDKKTNSLHYFHYYAVLDHINLFSLSESVQSTQLDLTQLLVKQDDIHQLENTTIIL